MWRDASSPDPVFTDTLELDLDALSRHWPARSVRRTVSLVGCRTSPQLPAATAVGESRLRGRRLHRSNDGDVVIAAITSCTNTSNPSCLIGAGLLPARRARWA